MSIDDLAAAPQADYVPAVFHAGLAYRAGMTSRRDGQLTIASAVS